MPVILSFFLLAPSAQAQGYWTPTACDAQGNTVDAQGRSIVGFFAPDNAGFSDLIGTESGTATNTYPVPMIHAALVDPNDYGYYLGCGNPVGPPSIHYPNTTLISGGIGAFTPTGYDPYTAGGTPNSVQANNFFGSSSFWYDVPTTFNPPANLVFGYVNGGVDANLTGTLVYRVKEVWYGSPPFNPPPTAANPMPTSITLLLRTTVKAKATGSYTKSSSGLSATGSASDGPPFNESVVANAGDAGGPGSPPSVVGYHLVTVAVNPATGIAEYDVNGTVEMKASNNVQYGVAPPDQPYLATVTNGPATAGATASVAAAYKIDNRTVTISATIDATSKKVPLLDANGNQTKDANGDSNYTSAPNTRSKDGTMYGDTIYSYHNYVSPVSPTATSTPPPLDIGTLNWIYFQPNYIGNWHYKSGTTSNGDSNTVPNVVNPDTWKWSPKESEDTWYYAKCSMPWAAQYTQLDGVSSGQDAPKTYPVSYSATDNTDQAQASANYVMTVHDPKEANYADHMMPGIENLRMAPNASYVRSTQNDSPLVVYAEKSDSWSIGPSASGDVSIWEAKVLNIGLSASYTYSYNAGVQATLQHVPFGYATYLEEFDAYKYHRGKVDQWTTSGYAGTAPFYIKEPDKPAGGYQAHSPAIPLPVV